MRYHKRYTDAVISKQKGDTIVEVLLAMVVIGLSIGVAYGISNRAIRTGQEAQERTTAQKLAESQLERLKAFSDVIDYEKEYYEPGFPAFWCVPDNLEFVDANDATLPCDEYGNSIYDIRMEYTPGSPAVFRSIVTWEPVSRTSTSSNEDNRVEIPYRP